MSTTYPDYPHTNFPDLVDEIEYLEDADQSVITDLTNYQMAVANGDSTTAQELIDKDEGKLKKYLFTAEKYNILVDGLLALQRYFVDRFYNVILELAKAVHVAQKKDTGENADEVNMVNAYSVAASEELFAKKPTFVTVTLYKDKWQKQPDTQQDLWYYDLEDEYPNDQYDIEVTPSNRNTIALMKVWNKYMFSGYQVNNWIGTRVGIPTSDLQAILKITKKN